jgi:hypothetical protein
MNLLRLAPLFVASVFVAGCTREVAVEPKTKKPPVVEVDGAGVALEDIRTSSNVSGLRDALRRLNPSLEKQSDSLRLSPEHRAWLEKAGLRPDDFVEIDAKSFRPLDAHHVDTSIVFRDAAKTFEIAGLDPLEQTKFVVDWVDRRVLLHQHAQEGLPAAYSLRASFGGPGDRSAVLLAVLHQLRVPGCVLALPGATEPSLVAVVADKKAYLFDPRTGRAVPTADRKEIATWTQLRAEPALGKFVDLTPEQVAKLEAKIMVPLEALSPRMEYLERLLQGDEAHVGGDRIGLHVDVVQLDRSLADAGVSPVGLWNPNPELGPLHALRRFLPAEEGGTDVTGRLIRFTRDLVPSGPVLAQYRELQLLGQRRPSPVDQAKAEALQKLTETLFELYYQQPQEMLVRGKTESRRRLDRIRSTLDDFETAEGNDRLGLKQASDSWRKRADEAYLDLIRKNPSAGEKIARLWNEETLDYLLRVDREGAAPRVTESKILTRLILSAVHQPMSEQANFLLAGLSQDQAERAEVVVGRLRIQKRDPKVAEKKAFDAWKNAESGWDRYVHQSNLGPSTLPDQLKEIRKLRDYPELALAWLEHVELQLHRYASAKMQLARAQARLGKQVDLEPVAVELDPIAAADGPLAKEVEAFRELVRELPPEVRETWSKRLDLLRRDYGPDGYLAWTIREIRDK